MNAAPKNVRTNVSQIETSAAHDKTISNGSLIGHSMKLGAVCALLMILLLFANRTASAQGYGTISGTVTDSTGAVVPGAEVSAKQTATGVTLKTITNGEGTFVFPSLAPSVYDISVSMNGFGPYLEKGLQVRADAAVTANAILKTGSMNESVTVNAEAAQVDTTTGTLSQVIGSSQVNNLPLNGRNAAQLTTLVAGVAVAPFAQADQGATKTFPGVVTITANGTRVGQTNYLLDGGNNMDEYTNVNAPFPMPDSLQEFSVQTSNYNAEYGQNAGGVVNIVTKSGTSKYHGNLFEFVRNRVFNAANYFSYVNGVKTVDPLKRNQFGGTLGGPVSIPHLFHSDKSFFFVGYQKTIQHTSSITSATIPTAAEINTGVFANESSCIVNPIQPAHVYPCVKTGNTYTTTVNPADYSSVSSKLLTYMPISQANASGTVFYQKPNFTNFDELTARFDQQIGANDHLVVRYFQDFYNLQGVLNLSNLLTYADQANIKYYNSLISETHTFNSHWLNNFILSYQIDNASRGPLPGSINVNDLGVNIWQPAFSQINQIQINGGPSAGFQIGDNPQGFFRRANYTLADDVHFQWGNHNIGFGFHGEVSKIDVNNLYRQPGVFNFNANNVGDPFASFLFGYVEEFAQASGQFFNARDKFYGAYIQDSWKVNRRLTLNYGLRYEPFIPWKEIEGRMGSFFPTLWAQGVHSNVFPNAPAGLQFTGDKGFNPSGVDSELNHFMPRLGFAWDVFGTGKTSLRGGTGMFYDTRVNSTLFDIYTNTSPFITNVDVTNAAKGTVITFNNPYGSYGTPNPFPAPQPPAASSAIPPQSFLTFDPFSGFKDPINYSWNLAVEQQVSSSFSTRIAYVGEVSRHQWVNLELNPFVNGTRIYNQAGCAVNNSCYTQPITAANTGGNTNYHSLQVSGEQRFRYGLTLLANYTWSKALDNLPYNQAATSIGPGNSYVLPYNTPNYRRLDYGPSDFDHRNVVSISYVYAIPHLADSTPSVLRYVANGWETTGLFQFSSGDPLTVVSSQTNNSGSGQTRDRAMQIGLPYGGSACGNAAHCKSFLNPASFTNNAVGTYGNVIKGAFVGPQYTDWDTSLARRFTIKGETYVQFRAEYFNVLNHTNFGDPNTTATNSTFGQITSTSPQNSASTAQYQPRIAQLSLKLAF